MSYQRRSKRRQRRRNSEGPHRPSLSCGVLGNGSGDLVEGVVMEIKISTNKDPKWRGSDMFLEDPVLKQFMRGVKG